MPDLVRVVLCAVLALLLTAAAAAPAAVALEQVTLLAAGPLDGRAVLQLPNKRLLELRVGEQLPGSAATLVRVTDGLAVFEDHPGLDQAPQTVWLRLKGRAERLRITPDPAPVAAAAPVVVRVPVTPPPARAAARASAP